MMCKSIMHDYCGHVFCSKVISKYDTQIKEINSVFQKKNPDWLRPFQSADIQFADQNRKQLGHAVSTSHGL